MSKFGQLDLLAVMESRIGARKGEHPHVLALPISDQQDVPNFSYATESKVTGPQVKGWSKDSIASQMGYDKVRPNDEHPYFNRNVNF